MISRLGQIYKFPQRSPNYLLAVKSAEHSEKTALGKAEIKKIMQKPMISRHTPAMHLKILIIGTVWPEPHSSAAGSRMLQLIQVFKEMDWSVTFASTASASDYACDLGRIGVDRQSIKINDPSFDNFIRAFQPDVVLFDRFMTEEQFGWRVAENYPEALRLLDTVDLHFLRDARRRALRSGDDVQLVSDLTIREVASIYRSDLSLIISEAEIQLLQNDFNMADDLLHYTPFMLDPVIEKEGPSFHERNHFISIGNFLHAPNKDAVLQLHEQIWPKIRVTLPSAELHICGAYPTQQILQLHNPSTGFLVKGRVDDVAQVMPHARICLAPICFGAGLKGKLIDAMKFGTPSVTTAIGAEGMNGVCAWPGFIAKNDDQFIKHAIELYQDNETWMTKQSLGFSLLRERFAKSEHAPKLTEILIHRLNRLNEYRENNFIGTLLRHHTASSTKYMAKWIEAKNRNLLT